MNALNVYKKLYKCNLKKIESLAIMKRLTNTSTSNKPIEIYLDKITRVIEIKYNIFLPPPAIRYDTKYHQLRFSLGTISIDHIGQFYDLFLKYFINLPENYRTLMAGNLHLTTKNQTEEEKLDFIIEYIERLYELEIMG